MRKAAFLMCLVLAAALAAPAQQAAPAAPATPSGTYRLSFVIHETEDGKPAATHAYTMLLDDGASGSIRTGATVPIVSASSVQYRDVGLRLECSLRARDGQLLLKTTLSFNQVAGQANPEMRNSQTENTALVPVGKPAVIFSFDDWATKSHYDVEVTALKVK